MDELAQIAIDAHGGSDRWSEFECVSARLLVGGVLWSLKGKDGILSDVHVSVDLRRVSASHRPFKAPHQRTSFRHDRIAIETEKGEIVEERFNPRESFAGHTLETKWDDLHLAYFAGYAMWTYLNVPFLFEWENVQTEELAPWDENGESWRRLRVSFPKYIPTHSTVQTFYFDRSGLLRRHDYETEVIGGSPAAHYVSEHKEFSGILVPTKRRVYIRDEQGRPVKGPLIVSIDLIDVDFK